MSLPRGWERESADLFVHESGARVSKTTYRGRVAWWFFPVSLDVQAVEYPPTEAGRDEAFEKSGKDLPKVRSASPKPRAAVRGKRSAEPVPSAEPDGDDEDREEDTD